jgi:2-oxoglutarate/2-oxoacid ferredoxin oxidoreductase subunit beta
MSPLTRKDYLSKSEPRWCLGCGSYATFRALTDVFAETQVPREKLAVISGIGCSSRLPYYVNTYGFHSIHGRAPTIAMGLKLVNPELEVWIATGDGDGLSIGGNHFLHMMRRNADLKVILFNNQIYGLTKGQASPTTGLGTVTKSSPHGSVDLPIRPLSVAIAAGATYAARVTDADGELLKEALLGAARHKGIAFVEVLINCVIYNDGAFSALTDKEARLQNTIRLRHGEPMVFGKEREKALRMRNGKLEIVSSSSGASNGENVLVHDARNPDSTLAYMLSQVERPAFPTPLGIFTDVEKPVYTPKSGQAGPGDFERLLQGGSAWVWEKDGTLHTVE